MYVDNSQNDFLTDSLSLVLECKLFYPASIRFSPLHREVSTFRNRRLYLQNNNISNDFNGQSKQREMEKKANKDSG